jgi:hypothetical protein
MALERIDHRIYRAGERLHLLEAEIEKFIDSGEAYDFARDEEAEEGVRLFEIRANRPPPSIARLAGEIALELRTALNDLARWACGEDVLEFPVTRSPDEFEAWADAHCPEIGEEERALIEASQPHEHGNWLSDLVEVADRYESRTLVAEVLVNGSIARSFPIDEAQAEPDEQPLIAHVIAPDHGFAMQSFNVHMHIALAIQVVAATPIEVVAALGELHTSVRELVDALNPLDA